MFVFDQSTLRHGNIMRFSVIVVPFLLLLAVIMSFTEEELAEKCGRCVGGFLPDEDGVQCDECNDWFHYECEGIQPEDQEKLAHQFSKFYCSTCSSKDSTSPKTRKKLSNKLINDITNYIDSSLVSHF